MKKLIVLVLLIASWSAIADQNSDDIQSNNGYHQKLSDRKYLYNISEYITESYQPSSELSINSAPDDITTTPDPHHRMSNLDKAIVDIMNAVNTYSMYVSVKRKNYAITPLLKNQGKIISIQYTYLIW